MNKYVERPLVYVAGPYMHPDPVENTNKAIRIGALLVEDFDVTPVIPHLTLLWHLADPHPADFWYAYDLAMLARCDALFRIPGASKGADEEVKFADKNNIPVFANYEALRRWAKNFNGIAH